MNSSSRLRCLLLLLVSLTASISCSSAAQRDSKLRLLLHRTPLLGSKQVLSAAARFVTSVTNEGNVWKKLKQRLLPSVKVCSRDSEDLLLQAPSSGLLLLQPDASDLLRHDMSRSSLAELLLSDLLQVENEALEEENFPLADGEPEDIRVDLERAAGSGPLLAPRERKAGCKNFFWKTFTSC